MWRARGRFRRKHGRTYKDDTDMEISLVERLMQIDMWWDIRGVEDMSMMDDPAAWKDYTYFDKNTLEPLDAFLV